MCFFCVKQKTAYEMRISDWSSDVCSSDLWPRPSTQPPHCCLRHPTGKPPTARPPPCGNEPQIASARPVPPPARPASPGCGRQNLHPNNGGVQAAACLGSAADRHSVVTGKSVSVRVDHGGRVRKKKPIQTN